MHSVVSISPDSHPDPRLGLTRQVAYPGVIGLTDEEAGFSAPTKKPERSSDTVASGKSTPGPGRSTSAPSRGSGSSSLAGSPPPEELHRQVGSSSGSTSYREDSAGDTNNGVEKGADEPRALDDAASSNAELQDDAELKDVTLEDLATASDVPVLPGRWGPSQRQGSRSLEAGVTAAGSAQEEDARTKGPEDDGRRGSGSTRGAAREEYGRRGAGKRRGTDECSLYFRSDDGLGGEDRRVPSPSRRTSTMSSGSVGGRGRRTVYLGRTQAFPLRRVESSLAVDARGFGLSGVSADKAVGKKIYFRENALVRGLFTTRWSVRLA